MSSDALVLPVAELQARGWLLVEDGNHGEQRPRSHEFGAGEWAFIRAADLDGGAVRFSEAQRINDIARQRIRKGIGAPGDVLLTHKGTVGKVAFVPDDAPPFVCSPQTTFWRSLAPDRIDRRYLYAYLSSREFQQQLDSRKGETDMAPYVSLTAQRQLLVTLPEIAAQRAIGSLLGALDDKIELNRRMGRALETTAAALFRSWFVDFDPVVAKSEGRRAIGAPPALHQCMPLSFGGTGDDAVPDGWRVGSVRDLASFVNGRNFTTEATGTGRMVIRIAEMGVGARGSTIYNDVSANDENVARAGDLLFSWSGSLRVVRWHGDESLVNQHIFKVVCSTWPQWFVHHHLDLALPVFQEIAAGKATTMGHIKREHLSQARVALPPSEVLTHAGKVIEPLYARVHLNERENRTLSALREVLLPQLLSGTIRLRDAERAVTAAV